MDGSAAGASDPPYGRWEPTANSPIMRQKSALSCRAAEGVGPYREDWKYAANAPEIGMISVWHAPTVDIL